MRKLLSVLLVVSMLAALLGVSASASYLDYKSTDYIQNGTTMRDLSAYGIPSFYSYKVQSAPVIDGVISTGEYPAVSNVATVGNGLSVTNSGATVDFTNDAATEDGKTFRDLFSAYTLTSYLAYDNEFAYIAEVLSAPEMLSHTTANGQNSTMNVNLRLGINQSELLPEAYSALTNSYAYRNNAEGDLASYYVSACTTGTRILRNLASPSPSMIILSNSTAYYDANGVDWTLNEYKKEQNTNIQATENPETGLYEYVYEYRIPLGDLFQTCNQVPDLNTLLSQNVFYGSYLFQVCVTRTGGMNGNTQLYLSTGFGGSRAISPYDKNSTAADSNWMTAVRAFWPATNGGSAAVSYIPSPVVFCTYDPANPYAAPTSSFRPALTGVSFKAKLTGIKLGDTFTFEAIGDGMESPVAPYGDYRYVPETWRIRAGNATKMSGYFNGQYTVSLETKDLEMGRHTLYITYAEQQFDGTSWKDTGKTRSYYQSFTIGGSVRGVSQGSPGTGDTLTLALVAGGVMLVSAAAFAVVTAKKKKLH